jgi:hypothetical protein
MNIDSQRRDDGLDNYLLSANSPGNPVPVHNWRLGLEVVPTDSFSEYLLSVSIFRENNQIESEN